MWGAWITSLFPIYKVTCLGCGKTKSPGCNSSLLTSLPLLIISEVVLSISIPKACLYTYWQNPEQSKQAGVSPPRQ